MAGKRSMDARRSKIKEVSQQVESARTRVESLKEDKREALDARNQLEGADIDEGVKSQVASEIDSAIQSIEAKGQEVSDELNEGNSELEEIRQETDEEISENASQKSNVEKVQSMLGQIGLDGAMSGAIGKLEAHDSDLHTLLDENIEAMRSLQEVSQQAASI